MLNSSFSEILSELAATHQCRQASLMTRSGSLVGLSRGAETMAISTHENLVSSVTSALSASSRELYRVLGEEEPEYVLIRGAAQTTLISEMPNQLLLVAVFPSAVEEAVARAAAEFVGERLASLSPVGDTRDPEIAPDLRDQTLRFLDEIFA